jgi:heat-inducible transcriptional repressor
VVAPKLEEPLKHIEFVSLGPGRALVVLVTSSGIVENRVIDVPAGLPPSSLVEATNYLSARLIGHSLGEAAADVRREMVAQKAELDGLTQKVVEQGLASWAGEDRQGALIVRGQAQLLEDVSAVEDLERIRQLFTVLEAKETLLNLLQMTETANNSQQQLVGAVGVIGPTRIDYARIIPMVDYTAKVIGRLIR